MNNSKIYTIDVRSDTITKPTKSMRNSMLTAEVGDDVFGEDPTVKKLEERVAKILGKEAALFVTSGTMGNMISAMVQCSGRGEEIIVGDKSHIFKYEQGGVSQIGGVVMTTIKNNDDGTFDLEELEKRIRGSDIHEPKTRLISIENTHNVCGGKVVPMDWIEDLIALAKKYSLLLHLDGARLFNASTYLNINPSKITEGFDSVSICFSKGLGAPAGSAIAGSFDFIKKARRLRKVLGGGMRQVGVLAAPALVALFEIVPILENDHKRASSIANAINALNSSIFSVDIKNLHTNIVMIKVNEKYGITAEEVVKRCASVNEEEIKKGCTTDNGEGIIVKIIAMPSSCVLMRIVTHFDISDIDTKYLIKKVTYVFKEVEHRVREL